MGFGSVFGKRRHLPDELSSDDRARGKRRYRQFLLRALRGVPVGEVTTER
ncbi:MAG: hypothetical protein ACLFP4_06555 [Spirochaetales bacterium]